MCVREPEETVCMYTVIQKETRYLQTAERRPLRLEEGIKLGSGLCLLNLIV